MGGRSKTRKGFIRGFLAYQDRIPVCTRSTCKQELSFRIFRHFRDFGVFEWAFSRFLSLKEDRRGQERSRSISASEIRGAFVGLPESLP
jgi:hypothetical protein